MWLLHFLAVFQRCPGRGLSHLGNRNDTANDTAKTTVTWKNSTVDTQEESRHPKQMELRWDTVLTLLFQLTKSTL